MSARLAALTRAIAPIGPPDERGRRAGAARQLVMLHAMAAAELDSAQRLATAL